MTTDTTTAIEELLDEVADATATIEAELPDEIHVTGVQTDPSSHDDIAIRFDAPALEAQLEDAFDDLTVDVDASGTVYVPTEDNA